MADTKGDLKTQRIQSWKKTQRQASPTPNSAKEETEAQELGAINHKKATVLTLEPRVLEAWYAVSYITKLIEFLKYSGPYENHSCLQSSTIPPSKELPQSLPPPNIYIQGETIFGFNLNDKHKGLKFSIFRLEQRNITLWGSCLSKVQLVLYFQATTVSGLICKDLTQSLQPPW